MVAKIKTGETAMASRALVLGGGGPVGIAWESGLLAGLAKAGVNLGDADFIMGTSAGSFVGMRLAFGAETATLADPILAERPPAAASGGRSAGAPNSAPADLAPLMRLMGEAQGGTRDSAEVRREIGAFALGAKTMSEDDFIASFGRTMAGLPQDAWPPKAYACTAVDALTGAFQLWTGADGIGVGRAVASSCSVPGVYPPVTIKGRRYIDGGMRSGTNADQATGHEKVVVVALRLGGGTEVGNRIAARLDEEMAALKAGGAEVRLVVPDEGSLAAMGVNLMDFRKRAGAAAAAVAQGEAQAASLKAFWTA
jgi:NTE family protein